MLNQTVEELGEADGETAGLLRAFDVILVVPSVTLQADLIQNRSPPSLIKSF